jgi:putative tryptophan/tyrosine transport system substrate-binding protein
VALLFNPATAPQFKFFMPSIQDAALSHAVEVSAAPVHAEDEIEGVIVAQAGNPGGSLIVMPDVFTDTHRQLIISLMARYCESASNLDPLAKKL